MYNILLNNIKAVFSSLFCNHIHTSVFIAGSSYPTVLYDKMSAFHSTSHCLMVLGIFTRVVALAGNLEI